MYIPHATNLATFQSLYMCITLLIHSNSIYIALIPRWNSNLNLHYILPIQSHPFQLQHGLHLAPHTFHDEFTCITWLIYYGSTNIPPRIH
jgi:hypothetical protein